MFNHKIPHIELDIKRTALVFTDLHNDFLSPDGKAYGLIKESLARNNTRKILNASLGRQKPLA
jgi:nicotinamidase-related amidase